MNVWTRQKECDSWGNGSFLTRICFSIWSPQQLECTWEKIVRELLHVITRSWGLQDVFHEVWML